MKPTKEYIQDQFNRFNNLIFAGKLPAVRIELSAAGTFLGRAEYRAIEDDFGIVIGHTDYVLRISTKYDIEEAEVQDTVIHEMIHLYIAFFNVRDDSAHGQVFRAIMKIINEKYGRNVIISHKCTEEEIEQDNTAKQHILCVTELNDWDHGITVCARSKVFQIIDELPKRFRFKSMKIYLSTDPYFNRYPKATTAKIFKISEDLFVQHMKGAIEMVIEGKYLKPKK